MLIAGSMPELASVADLILSHHEYWDGSGYPLGLKGEGIPIESRILSIVVVYEMMVNPKQQFRSLNQIEALAGLIWHSGLRFDPRLVKLFLARLKTTC